MSEAVLVAESAIKGGAMATARQALSYNREVMALPGDRKIFSLPVAIC